MGCQLESTPQNKPLVYCIVYQFIGIELFFMLWNRYFLCIYKMYLHYVVFAFGLNIDHKFFNLSVAVLKLVSAIFYQFFIFSPNDSPSDSMKNVFISSKKFFSFSRFQIFVIFSVLSTLSRFKRMKECGIIYDVINCLA